MHIDRSALEIWTDLEESYRLMMDYHPASRTHQFACAAYEKAVNTLVMDFNVPRDFIASRVRMFNTQNTQEAGNGS